MYTVNLSRGSFGLLIGWLSDLGLEAIWDVSKDASRYKEAVRTIINQRLKLKGALMRQYTELPGADLTFVTSCSRRFGDAFIRLLDQGKRLYRSHHPLASKCTG